MFRIGKNLRKVSGSPSRVGKRHFITRSGKKIKLRHNLLQRYVNHKDLIERRKAERLAKMPKGRLKRFFYKLHPKRLAAYWFSREGFIMGLKIMGVGSVVCFLLLVGVFAYFRKDLPNLRDISGNNIGGSIRYYDRTGQTLLWEDYDAVKRIPVKDEEIAQVMKDATVAIEDKDFFKHGGFDVRGIARAAWNNAFGSGGTQGGSTITQQLVKLTQNWSKERTVTRKVKELILSVELERSYSKKEILTGYLNTAPYGGIEYGVEAAARDYFDKSAKDLTLDEAAMLASIPKSPRYYSKYSADFDIEAFIGRQHYVLDLMEQQGMINKEARDEAKKIDTLAKVKPRKPKFDGIKAPWFVLTAKQELEEKYVGETAKIGGWKVITTLDLGKQQIAEEEVQKGLAQVRRQRGDTAAFVAEDVKTGQVVALVGGDDFNNAEYGQNNYAHDYQLPPGSSFKPYDYAAVIEHTTNFGAGSVLYDTIGPLEGYPCTNKANPKQGGNCLHDYDFRFPGPLTLRYALGGSRNVPAVKAMLIAGVDKTIETAEKMGLKSGYKCYADDELTKESQCYASSAIGDGAYLRLDEHVHAFGTFSRNGRNIPQTYILKIEDAAGKTLPDSEWKPTPGEQVIREDTAFIVTDMLQDPNASYFSRKPHRYKGHKFALKTGTTNDAKDGWLMGFSPQYSAGVWVGYHNRRVEMSGFMENMTEPIWGNWMRRVHDGLQPEDWARPKGVQNLPAFVVRSHVGVGSVEPSPSADLYPSWYQQQKKTTGTKKVIDQVSNKLATDCTPARAKKEVTETAADNFSGDRFVNNGTTTEEKDDVHKCDDTKPSIDLTGPTTCNGSCTFTATVASGSHALSSDRFKGTVNFIIDGQIIQSFEVSVNGSVNFNFTPSFDGSRTLTAEIIDSVLYDASDSQDVSFSTSGGGASPLTIIDPTAGQDVNAGSYVIKWSGGSGPYSVSLNGAPVATCTAISATSCTVTLAGANDTAFTATVSTGSESKSVSFKK
jgi:membrane peptidoglycan carboxypeptidase